MTIQSTPITTSLPTADAPRALPRVTISVEIIAYALLFIFALALRYAQLDVVPLTADEAREALSAWRTVSASAPGSISTAHSPLVFLAQSFGFSVMGASEQSARLLTMLVGAGLVLTPMLFRAVLGKARALLLAALFVFSPILLIASRESSGMIWGAMSAALMLASFRGWLRRRDVDEAGAPYAALTLIFAVGVIFLSDAGSLALAGLLAVGVGGALVWTRRAQDVLEEDAEDNEPVTLASLFRAFPWASAFPAALIVTLTLGTGFLLIPSALTTIGEVFLGFIQMLTPNAPDDPAFLPLTVAAFYEPHVLIFAGVALWMLVRAGFTFADRVAAVMLVAAIVFQFVGAPAATSLWILLPAMFLASGVIVKLFNPDTGLIFAPAPDWARGVIALSLIGALCVFTLAFQSAGRSMVSAPDGALASVRLEGDAIILLFVSTMFILIGFFLFASLWGARMTWQGMGLGVLLFFGATSLGAGWSVAVDRADQPAQIWRDTATRRDTALLRQTMIDLTEREARGFTGLPVSVIADNDGVIAWVLRDFPNTSFINAPSEAAGQAVVLLPANNLEPELGTAYVGQDFAIERRWQPITLMTIDLPGWWSRGLARVPSLADGTDDYVLWLRQDIYDGVLDTVGVAG